MGFIVGGLKNRGQLFTVPQLTSIIDLATFQKPNPTGMHKLEPQINLMAVVLKFVYAK